MDCMSVTFTRPPPPSARRSHEQESDVIGSVAGRRDNCVRRRVLGLIPGAGLGAEPRLCGAAMIVVAFLIGVVVGVVGFVIWYAWRMGSFDTKQGDNRDEKLPHL